MRAQRAPIAHTEEEDCLPSGHPLAEKDVHCDACGALLHCWNNECMQAWVESAEGNFCTEDFNMRSEFAAAVARENYEEAGRLDQQIKSRHPRK